MSKQAANTSEPKTQSVANAHTQLKSQGEPGSYAQQLPPQAVAQRKLQAAADGNPNAIQPKFLQEMADGSPQVAQAAQLQAIANNASSPAASPVQRSENKTGLPDQLKSNMEGMSGLSLDDVQVHHNSDQPAQLNAHAYAQGTDIHLAPGQEKHLPHEAWHVVQQKQGRVQATTQRKGMVGINDDPQLEKEADVMGAKAVQMAAYTSGSPGSASYSPVSSLSVAQLQEVESAATITTNLAWGLVKAVLAKEAAKASWASIITPLLKAGDTFLVQKVTSLSGLASYVPVFNGLLASCRAALAAWDMLPANIKTSILYVLGMATAGIPLVNRYPALQDFVVKSDTGEVRETVQGWVDTVSSKMTYLTQPLSSLYSWLTGSSETTEAAPQDPEQSSPEEAARLLNVNLQVITLMANDLRLGYENEPLDGATKKEPDEEKDKSEDKGAPGLIVDFFVQLHLFGQDLPERGEQSMDRLFFPFAGEFNYTASSPIIINSKERTLLGNTLGPVSIAPLKVSKSGVKEAGINISQLIIGNGLIILTDASGRLENKLVTLQTKAQLNLAGYSIGGSMKLQLDDGAFKQLDVTDVNAEGNFKLKQFSINNEYSGEAHVQMDTLDLFNNALSAKNVNAKGQVENKELKNFEFGMDAFNFDALGVEVSVTDPYLKYAGNDPNKGLEKSLSGGASEISAQLGSGVGINLQQLHINQGEGVYEFSKGRIQFNDFEIEVTKAKMIGGGIEITQASLILPHFGLRGDVNGFTWNSEGLDFKSMVISLPGKTIEPIEQVRLSNMSLTISKEGGYALTVASDIMISPNGTPLLGAEQAALKMSKEEISGTLAKLNVTTSMFDVMIENAEFNKERIGAAAAKISFKSKEEDDRYSNMIPSFDTGLLDFINLSTALKAEDVYFNKGKGFSVGSVSPMIQAFSVNLFGVKATVNPEERSLTVESDITLPGNIPGIWPFSLSVPFPIVIGVAGHFGIELGGGVTLDFKAKAQKEKGKKSPYKFDASPGIHGSLYLKISAGVELGQRLLVALQANLYAQAQVAFQTQAQLSGSVIYRDGHLEQEDPLKMLYELRNIITAEVGGELKLKAFLFYDKQLARVKFKDWTLGEWLKSGELGSDKGELKNQQNPGKFANDPTSPDMDQEILEGKEADQLMLDAQTRIIGSGEKRKEILSGLTMDVKGLSSQLLSKHQLLKRKFDGQMNELMEIILKKDLYFRKHYESDNVQQKLDEFDQQYKLEEKREIIRGNGDLLDKYEAELSKILGLMNNVEAGLDARALEAGMGQRHEDVQNQSAEVKNIQKGMEEIIPVDTGYQAMSKKLETMGAEALTVEVATSVMTAEKFIEISTSKKRIGSGDSERDRVLVVDAELRAFDAVRNGTVPQQIEALLKVQAAVNAYLKVMFSSRTEAALLLQYQVQHALAKLRKA